MKLNFTICSLLFFILSFSQKPSNQETIANSIHTYFSEDRENIHVQFNKTTFLNDEDIAFKGYVFSKIYNLPNVYTTNIQLVIYNEQHEVVQKQLLYATLGVFEGVIPLNENFKTGKYYFRFFTNWMNNFIEEDSFLQVVEVINKKETYALQSAEPDLKTATLSFFPESGSIINGINNRVGIKIVDCHQKGIEISEGTIIDSKSNEVTNFRTNKMGYGNFFYIPDSNETYTLKIKTDKISITQALPKAEQTGIAITCNTNLPNDILAVAVKTNMLGVDQYKNKKFILVVHQYGNSVQKEFTFEDQLPEQDFYFKKKDLFKGVNSIRVIDENLNEVAERLVYLDETSKTILNMEAKAIAKDSVVLVGDASIKKAHLSISLLPDKTACYNQRRSILGTFYLNAFLENPEQDTYSYFDIENKSRKQDMDLLMLNQKRSKYLWNSIKSVPPQIKYPFTKGVTISGKIEKKLTATSKNKILLIALKSHLIQETSVDKNNEYKFENFYAKDSTVFLLQLLNEKNMNIKTKMSANVSQEDTLLRKPLTIKIDQCPTVKNPENTIVFKAPNLDKSIINLGEVAIKNTFKKEVFLHKKEMNIVTASAYKIGENDFGTILSFLDMHGYSTGISTEDNEVYIRSPRNGFGSSNSSPTVYIDNDLLYDFNLLYSLNLSDIDEIYIDKMGFSEISSRGGGGTIKIFMKKGIDNKYFNPNYTSLIVTKGFATNRKYKKTPFGDQKEFDYFGTLNWSPNVLLKDDSKFKITFPKESQSDINVFVEGFTDDGQLVSEIKKMHIM